MTRVRTTDLSQDARIQEDLTRFDENRDGFIETSEVDRDNDGLLDCSLVPNDWHYDRYSPVEQALFSHDIVSRARRSICSDLGLTSLPSFPAQPVIAATPWWQRAQYAQPNFFATHHLYHRTGRRHLDLGTIVQHLDARNSAHPPTSPLYRRMSDVHEVTLAADGAPRSFVPRGRSGGLLRRDEMFFRHARSALAALPSLNHTLFINYTGHQGGVGAALAERGVPLVWRLEASDVRIANTLQDYHSELFRNPNTRSTSVGLMVEPNHGLTDISTTNLPNETELRSLGITRVVVLSEGHFRRAPYRLEEMHVTDPNFIDYLTQLETGGLPFQVFGLDDL